MSKKGLEWSQKQAEVAKLLQGGADSQAVIAKGYSKTMVSRVQKALKAGQVPPTPKVEPHPEPTPKQDILGTQGETQLRPRSVDVVTVGEILIEPADWRINQFGGFLILSTLEYARRKYGYTGTAGEFICDCTQLARTILGLDMVSTDYLWPKEDDNGRRKEGSQGSSVVATGGEEANRGVAEHGEVT